MDWAKAKGHRSGDNPTDGTVKVLPKHKRKKEHFAALKYPRLPEFILTLRAYEGVSTRLAFEFLILTAAPTSEVLLAKWAEIDMKAKTWTVPDERMKAGEEHCVPLSPRCLEILKAAKKISDGDEYIFAFRTSGNESLDSVLDQR